MERIRHESVDGRGRRTVEEIVGYHVDGRHAGSHAIEPLPCEWDQSRAAPRSGSLVVPLGRRAGFASLRATQGRAGSQVELTSIDGPVEPIDSELPLAHAKTWAPRGGTEEIVLLQYAGGALDRLVVLRLRDGAVSHRETLTFEKQGKQPLEALLSPRGASCVLRARRARGPSCRAADYSLEGGSFDRLGGTLRRRAARSVAAPRRRCLLSPRSLGRGSGTTRDQGPRGLKGTDLQQRRPRT